MDEPPAELIELSNQEVARLTKALSSLIPEGLPVTIMLYQPLPHHDRPTASRLIDIGPRALDWPVGPVVQPTSVGKTGAFIHSPHYARRFIPSSETITSETRESYASGAWATAQVALERLRYADLTWDSDRRPPEGAVIHHLSISPPVDNLYSSRLPSLGVVYSLTRQERAGEEESDRVQRLIHAAQVTARSALATRTELLLGSFIRKLETYFSGHPVDRRSWEDAFFLAAKFILVHHWFYPSAPAAYQVLRRLASGDESADLIYRRYCWWPPELTPERDASLDELITEVVEDLLQLGSYVFPGNGMCAEADAFFKAVVATAFFALTGDIAVAEEVGERFRSNGSRRAKAEDYIFILPELSESLNVAVCLAVYEKKKLLDQARAASPQSRENRQAFLRKLGPEPPPIGKLTAREQGFIRTVSVNGTSLLCAGDQDQVPDTSSMTQWMRCRLIELLEESPEGGRE